MTTATTTTSFDQLTRLSFLCCYKNLANKGNTEIISSPKIHLVLISPIANHSPLFDCPPVPLQTKPCYLQTPTSNLLLMLVWSHKMDGSAEISGQFVDDFVDKLKLNGDHHCIPENDDQQEEEEEVEKEEEDEEDEEDEEEFSFDCVGANNGSPVSADDIFHNGQIRPVFPLFDQSILFKDLEENRKCASLLPPLKKLFIEEEGDVLSPSSSLEPDGPHCAWAGKGVGEAEASGTCKKSNSTGFSKLRRFREFVLRSNSDGKDAFVFLNNHNDHLSAPTKKNGGSASGKKREKSKNVAVKLGKKDETVSSLHEKYRGKKSDRAFKGGDNKRKSYLPYRQDLVGFFTSSNSLSKNVHPF